MSMQLNDMIPGHVYNCSDGYGYEHWLALGPPSEEELRAEYGDSLPGGQYAKVKSVDTGEEMIWFASPGWGGIYIEPVDPIEMDEWANRRRAELGWQ